jgi:diguanylate cyclase (GGDEF)-like protein
VSVSSTPLPEPPGQPPRAAISQILDISERKRFESQLRHLADHDALTGLFNRHRFESELERIVADSGGDGRDAALLIMDLDGFKHVNDRFGHPVGDQLVRRIAELLRGVVRASDIIARLGGDEFAVILPDITPPGAEMVATRILEATRERGCDTIGQPNTRITASIGVTTFDGTTGLTGSELVVEADTAMYDAKSLGRDRHVVYSRAAPR